MIGLHRAKIYVVVVVDVAADGLNSWTLKSRLLAVGSCLLLSCVWPAAAAVEEEVAVVVAAAVVLVYDYNRSSC